MLDLSKALLAPIGRARVFYRKVTVPHIFIFVALIFLGTLSDLHFLRDSALTLIVKLGAVCFILCFNLIVSAKYYTIFPGLVWGELSAISLFLCGAALYFRLDPLFNTFIPLAALLLVLLPLSLRAAEAALIGLTTGSITVIFWCVFDILYSQHFKFKYEGLILFTAALSVFLLKSIFFPRKEDQLGSSLFKSSTQKANLIPTWDSSQAEQHEKEFSEGFSKLFAEEVISEIMLKLPILSLVTGSTVFYVALSSAFRNRYLAVIWLAVALFQCTVYLGLIRQREIRRILDHQLLIVLSTVLWWALVPALRIGSTLLSELLLLFLIFATTTLPWSRVPNLLINTLFAFLALWHLLCFNASGLFAGITFFFILIALRIGAINYSALILRGALPTISRAAESLASTPALLHILARCLSILNQNSHVLTLYSRNDALVLRDKEVVLSTVDPIYVKGLTHILDKHKEIAGVLPLLKLGEQFNGPFFDWFASIPRKVYFFRLETVLDNRAERIYIILPLSTQARLIGHRRTFIFLNSLVAVTRTYFNSVRTQFLSSDTWVATQRSISEREHEIKELTHLVNNIAQDISINCDSIKEESKNRLRSAEILKEVSGIEGAVRALAAGVSDMRWLKELIKLKEYKRTEEVDLHMLLKDLKLFAEHRAERRKKSIGMNIELQDLSGVAVASREFLEATLRLVVGLAIDRCEKSASLSVYEKDSSVVIHVRDDGELLSEQTIARLTDGQVLDLSEPLDLLAGAFNLARTSAGKFELAVIEQHNQCSLELNKVTIKVAPRMGYNQWALLVDDNLQVTTFYAHVAEALNLRYFTAASLVEAKSLLADHGRPRVVVTDIQLSDGSGIDLLRGLRSQYGSDLPVIVVSGDNEAEVEKLVWEAGATKFLTKPVNRGKLFEEISAVLK